MNANAAWRNNEGDVEIGPKGGPFYIDISGKTECGPFTSLDDAISKARAMGAGPGRKLVDPLLQRLREAPMPEPKTEAQEAAELVARNFDLHRRLEADIAETNRRNEARGTVIVMSETKVNGKTFKSTVKTAPASTIGGSVPVRQYQWEVGVEERGGYASLEHGTAGRFDDAFRRAAISLAGFLSELLDIC